MKEAVIYRMIRKVSYNDTIITYEFQRKKVKNINLRVKSDLSVTVSANKYVSLKYIDEFVISKGDFIISALNKFSKKDNSVLMPNFTNEDFYQYVNECFDNVYLLFADKISSKPTLRLKAMTSRWGSCNYIKQIITINKNLIYCQKEHIYYVMVHEFAHLLVHNHSKDFYKIVDEYCKDYKKLDRELNKTHIKRS